jgi:general secretion pathway protein I
MKPLSPQHLQAASKGKGMIPGPGGFTLLEVLVAIAILAISLTAIYGSQARSLVLASEAQFRITASFLAGMKLAELESGTAGLANDDGEFGDEYPGYSWKISVEDAVLQNIKEFSGIETDARRVEVTVSRQEEFVYSLQAYVLPGRRE